MGGLSRPAPPIFRTTGMPHGRWRLSDLSREPVPSERSRAYRKRFNQLTKLSIDLRAAAIQTGPDNKRLVSETFSLLKEMGYGNDDARKIISAVTKPRKRGRPARKQELHLQAFTLMLESERVTLGKAIRTLYDQKKLCDCGGTHTDSCCESFKSTARQTRQDFQTGVRNIKGKLRKYEAGRQLVEQYDVLHPDRKAHSTKKVNAEIIPRRAK